MMSETEFNDRIDELMRMIDENFGEQAEDVDVEFGSGVLTLTFPNRTKAILNRQLPVRQIWVAAKRNGYHYKFDAHRNQWLEENSGIELLLSLQNICQEQAGIDIEFQA